MEIKTALLFIFILFSVSFLFSQKIVKPIAIDNAYFTIYESGTNVFPKKEEVFDTPEKLIARILDCKSVGEYEKLVVLNKEYDEEKEKNNSLGPRTLLGSFAFLESSAPFHVELKSSLEFELYGEKRFIVKAVFQPEHGRSWKRQFHCIFKDDQWYLIYPNKQMSDIGFILYNVEHELLLALFKGEKTDDDILNDAIKNTRDQNGKFNIEKFYFLLNHGWAWEGKGHYFDYFMEDF